MTYKCFEELPVWQQAAQLYDRTDDFLEHAPRGCDRRLKTGWSVPHFCFEQYCRGI